MIYETWNLLYDDGQFGKLVEPPVFSTTKGKFLGQIRPLDRVLKWCWFLLTLRQRPEPATHPGLRGWYDILRYLETTEECDVLCVAQMLTSLVEGLHGKFHVSGTGKIPMDDYEEQKTLWNLARCIEYAVRESIFVTPPTMQV